MEVFFYQEKSSRKIRIRLIFSLHNRFSATLLVLLTIGSEKLGSFHTFNKMCLLMLQSFDRWICFDFKLRIYNFSLFSVIICILISIDIFYWLLQQSVLSLEKS